MKYIPMMFNSETGADEPLNARRYASRSEAYQDMLTEALKITGSCMRDETGTEAYDLYITVDRERGWIRLATCDNCFLIYHLYELTEDGDNKEYAIFQGDAGGQEHRLN